MYHEIIMSEECKNSRFTVDYSRSDGYYSADDENGYSLILNYDAKEKSMNISLHAPADEPEETVSQNTEDMKNGEKDSGTEDNAPYRRYGI